MKRKMNWDEASSLRFYFDCTMKALLLTIEAVMQSRLRAQAMANGVTLQAPETVFLSADTIFGTDIIIEPHVVIGHGVSIADDCHIKAFSHLDGASLARGCVIGPYARLRPGTKPART